MRAELWTLDELLSLESDDFDELVHETREHVETRRAEARGLREIPGNAPVVSRLEDLIDTECRNLQRFAFAFEIREGRSPIGGPTS